MATVDTVLVSVLVLTVGVGVAAALLAWRERDEPGAKPLVAMLGGQIWWSTTLIFDLQAATLASKLFWSDVRWVGIVLIPVAWLLFALEYTGRDEYLRWRYVAVLTVVPCVTVLIGFLGGENSLIYTDSSLVEYGGAQFLYREPGPWFWVITAYTYLLGLLGSIPLLGLVRSDSLPFRGQSVALLVGTLAPWASNALFLADAVPVPGLDPTPIAFAVSGVAYLGALTRFQLLGTSPSPNWRARRLVFERMQEGALVVDRHDSVVDMNERAGEMFDVDRSALGDPVRSLLPDYDRLEGPGEDGTTMEIGETSYDVTTSEIRDFHGRHLGQVLTFHDIGEYLRQQQRLEVLNRVFRHNIRTETNIIDGYAELLADGSGEAEKVRESAMRIAEMGEKARRITELFERGGSPAEPAPLADVVAKRVGAVREDYPDADIEVGSMPAVRVPGVIEHVVGNLVENAAEHNDAAEPRVEVRAETRDGSVEIIVADNGPGIEATKRAVLERGSERPLDHASGLGLWLVTWGANIAEGDVSFTDNDPRGSVVTVTVPELGGEAKRSGDAD